jgi:hypothetical protein
LSFERRRDWTALTRTDCTPSATDGQQDGVLHLRDGVDPLTLNPMAVCFRPRLPTDGRSLHRRLDNPVAPSCMK